MVTAKWSRPSNKTVSKKYYYITEYGCETLSELIALWKDFQVNVSSILQAGKDE